jgi:hypothetical protein
MARARREFEGLLTCTVGCIFFGAPFKGSVMANIALYYSSIFGNEAYDSLLYFMKTEKNDTLDEITEDFMEINDKLTPPITLVCVWEQVPTAVSYSERFVSSLPKLMQHKAFKASARAVLDVGSSIALKNSTVSLLATNSNMTLNVTTAFCRERISRSKGRSHHWYDG